MTNHNCLLKKKLEKICRKWQEWGKCTEKVTDWMALSISNISAFFTPW